MTESTDTNGIQPESSPIEISVLSVQQICMTYETWFILLVKGKHGETLLRRSSRNCHTNHFWTSITAYSAFALSIVVSHDVFIWSLTCHPWKAPGLWHPYFIHGIIENGWQSSYCGITKGRHESFTLPIVILMNPSTTSRDKDHDIRTSCDYPPRPKVLPDQTVRTEADHCSRTCAIEERSCRSKLTKFSIKTWANFVWT